MANPRSFAVRRSHQNKNAVVFIHGFGGDAYDTFGMMPAFVAGDMDLVNWDIHCFGYATGLRPDITGVWSADPKLAALSEYFRDRLREWAGQYQAIAVVAHSMGGLITQRAVLDAKVTDKISNILLFGTPSGGLKKARLLTKLFKKKQVADMAENSEFITTLRADWDLAYAQPPFDFDVVAGLSDQFVPPRSSHDPFAEAHRRWVEGNHVEMVKPADNTTDSVRYVVARLKKEPVDLDARREAPVDAVALIEAGHAQELVDRALALELLGQQDDAIALLKQGKHLNYYVVGALAGRYKRRWMSDPEKQEEYGRLALEQYEDGAHAASSEGKHKQAAYNLINAAFMRLAFSEDAQTAKERAEQTLAHLQDVKDWRWKRGTEAEAKLHLGQQNAALNDYRDAGEDLDARERSSMFQQAIWTSRLLENELLERQLVALLVVG